MQPDTPDSDSICDGSDNLISIASCSATRMEGAMHPSLDQSVYASIAVIAGKLISGKSAASLYDFALPGNIEIDNLPNAPRLKAFHVQFRDYIPGFASGSSSSILSMNPARSSRSLSTARPYRAYQGRGLLFHRQCPRRCHLHL